MVSAKRRSSIRSVSFASPRRRGSVLEAMRAARFAILILGRRHDAAGVIATDLFRRTDVWLVDIGLEASLEEGAMMATSLGSIPPSGSR